MSKIFVFMNATPTEGALNKREAWFPKTGEGYFDPSAKRYFDTKREKRAWLARHGMRETGELVNPNKPLAGRKRTRHDAQLCQTTEDYLRAQGGVEGLLNRLQRERTHV